MGEDAEESNRVWIQVKEVKVIEVEEESEKFRGRRQESTWTKEERIMIFFLRVGSLLVPPSVCPIDHELGSAPSH